MPIEMPRGVPFSVDTWTPCSMQKRHRFLTHAHKDHSQGITTYNSYPIYSTLLTRTLTLHYYPQLDESLFVNIEVGDSIVIRDPDGDFTVTAFDANHCPGAIMLLFEGTFGTILHTGDCRLNQECLQSLPEKYLGTKTKEPECSIDYIFLDCTFGRFSKMPSRHSAIRQLINCVWKHPGAPVVYLTCNMLGQEEILVNVSQTFGTKIFVDKEGNPESYQFLKLTVPEILTEDSCSRFHLFDGFPNLSERAEAKLVEARNNSQPEPLIIRPSAQWYACEEVPSKTEITKKVRLNEAVRDQSGIWHVCYSMHSSREELEWALQLLRPKWVVSTTPSCRAMELTYVKKHCFISEVASDDPLWKLLDLNFEVPQTAEQVSVKSASCSSILESDAELEPQLIVVSADHQKHLHISPPSKRPPVTLFGRARFGLPASEIFHEQKERDSVENDHCIRIAEQEGIVGSASNGLQYSPESHEETKGDVIHGNPSCAVPDEGQNGSPERTYTFEERRIKSPGNKNMVDNNIETNNSPEVKMTLTGKTSFSPNGSSKRFCANLRNMYRNMHVPMPRPLPSLVELMKSRKSAKRKFTF
ncbi:DRMBL domain-containing protein [Heracleum sosnowskyi]|uniref:DRMBL domain-containing protein n=1 Tax=Heracleum sosnowskyi TaxID=360622 RepID=A0AAD8JG00_9APIA|nr:DRMBL domain-containing protein [Heracleum sosnowskyi]